MEGARNNAENSCSLKIPDKGLVSMHWSFKKVIMSFTWVTWPLPTTSKRVHPWFMVAPTCYTLAHCSLGFLRIRC